MKNNVIEESLMEYTKQRFVAVLDIMGFKKIVESNQASVVYDQLKNIYDMAFESQKYFKLHFSIFSDSIFLITDDDSQESFEDIVIVASQFMRFLKQGIAINGAIAYGNVTYDQERNIVFGRPINEAHLCQESLFCYSLVLMDSVINRISSYTENIDFLNKPDVILEQTPTYIKEDKGWKIIEYAIINWCEFYCTSNPNAPFEEQMSEIRNSMAEFYMKAHGNNRAICYIKHTELMLKDWFDSTNSTNKWDLLNS